MSNSTPATIEDVARIAEVSIATVSRAIHMPEKVANSTRLKVSQAIAITGYTTNAMARSLRLGRSNMILVVAPDIGDPKFLQYSRRPGKRGALAWLRRADRPYAK